jgi:hypothetical protein
LISQQLTKSFFGCFFRTAHERSHIPDPYPRVSSFFERKERNTKHQFLCLKILGLPKFPWGFQVLIICQPLSLVSTACDGSCLPGREGVLDFLLELLLDQMRECRFLWYSARAPPPLCCFVSWGGCLGASLNFCFRH